MRVVPALAVLLTASPALAGAEAPRSYAGSAGPTRIVLTLEGDATGEDVWGRYFYQSVRRDIELQGTRRGEVMTLEARYTGDRIELRPEGAALVGTLTTAAKRRLPVRLTRVTAAADLPADVPPDLSLHERLQLAGLRLEPQATEALDGKAIRWFREAKSGVRLFRVQGGYPAPALAAMNAALTRNQWREVSNALGCTNGDGEAGVDGGVDGKPWLGPRYASYRWQASWDCAGAAHPDFAVEGHSFDGRTGREMTLEQVLPVGPAPVTRKAGDRWYSYRSDVFAPAVVKLLQRHHADEMEPVDPEGDECNYADPDVWSFPAWRLTPQGLWLGASFARVMRACDDPDWSVLPWSALAVKPE
ncbi:hypothetical protein LK533_05650 [Sphingomonas sp. PL-96]|uniref:hypothetical protein n=1 Tax=Sphingomonas sp. PL-96 TaxID=2887201 RepID=UPI001E2ECDEA|nr:hypothetical protein [Sphingomonas sp. PL-96]MCC2976157.1 hypothetical protein [Sphingomonas sp. PL-96]